MSEQTARPMRVLLVDADSNDVLRLRSALHLARSPIHIDVVESGEEALACLRQSPPYHTRKPVHLVVVDVKLPGISGIETFHAITSDPRLAWVPIVMMTGSMEDEDMLRAYTEHARGYLIKPLDIETFQSIVNRCAARD